MDIDYNAVAYAGAAALSQIADDARRKELDAFLMQVGPLIEAGMRQQVEHLVDEINSLVSDHYSVRLVHEDTQDFVEVLPVKRERPEEDSERSQ